MRPLAAALALLAVACPGTSRELAAPERDAEAPPPDAPIEAAAGPPQPVTIATWNVRNLFNDVADSPGLLEPEEIPSTAEYQGKLDALAGVLGEIDADVVVLEEVENLATAEDVGALLEGYAHVAVSEGNDPRGIDIAVLSRLPIEETVSHADEFFSPSTNPAEVFVFARDAWQVELAVNGRRLIPIGVHFKSGDDDQSTLKRLAEAEHTRAIVSQILLDDPQAAVVVLGDFNAGPEEAPLAALRGGPPTELVSATRALAASERWSVDYGGVRQLVDDQLCSEAAAALLDQDSVAVVHSAAVDAVSDHSPVVATYRVR